MINAPRDDSQPPPPQNSNRGVLFVVRITHAYIYTTYKMATISRVTWIDSQSNCYTTLAGIFQIKNVITSLWMMIVPADVVISVVIKSTTNTYVQKQNWPQPCMVHILIIFVSFCTRPYVTFSHVVCAKYVQAGHFQEFDTFEQDQCHKLLISDHMHIDKWPGFIF